MNQAIAGHLGYKFPGHPDHAMETNGWKTANQFCIAPDGEMLFISGIPNYSGDLNAITAIIRNLPDADFRKYMATIEEIGFRGMRALDYLRVRYAPTAEFLCEAFLRTVQKWKEAE